MSDLLATLWQSSTGLLERFRLQPSEIEALNVFLEETEEFKRAVADADGDPCEEAADVLVTTLNTLHALGYSCADFMAAVDAVIIKNDRKSHETHRVNAAGKVQRIGRE